MTTDPEATHPLSDPPPSLATRMAAAFASNAALTAILAVAHLSGHLGWSLAAFAAVTVGMSCWAGLRVGLFSAACAWMFYDGFIVGRHAHLAWHGTADLARIALLVGIALVVGGLRALPVRRSTHPTVARLSAIPEAAGLNESQPTIGRADRRPHTAVKDANSSTKV
jgi:hypothetical protein